MKDISNELFNYLKDKGLSQKYIAEKLEVSEQFVNALIKGRRPFGRKTSMEWENHFGLSAAWLMTGAGPMLKNNYQTTEEDNYICKEDYNENYIELLKQQIEDKNEIIKTQSELINQLKKRLGE